jgi:hypothetical protein
MVAKEIGRGLVPFLRASSKTICHLKLGRPNYYDDDKDIVIYKLPKQISGTYADGDYFTTRTRDICKPAWPIQRRRLR